jgi:uncharacterized protein (TIGR02145 family)
MINKLNTMRSLFILFLYGFLQPFIFLAQDVRIGDQVWMSKNLDVSTFRNGEVILQANDTVQWNHAGENKLPAWCYFNFNVANGKIYGKLYNFYAVRDRRGLAPKGYHIPTEDEWTNLIDFLGGEDFAGLKLKNISGWNNNGNGDNSSRLSCLPGGRCINSGNFILIGYGGYWWSSTESGSNGAWSPGLFYDTTEVFSCITNKSGGFSVRCVKD